MILETFDLIAKHTPRWMRFALCKDADPDLFHPEPGKSSVNDPKVKAAIKVCNHCAVKMDCLRWAFATGDTHAILGGKTAEQRTYIAKRVRRGRVQGFRAASLRRLPASQAGS